ncbi:MAG: hypothetical protein GTO53_04955, partial [Planctomycetales bacterium]|nr:hypothetical protein [Planctomycetales bacterium]NIO46087.1 hypothetical protein [Planctomycetales bacterium]
RRAALQGATDQTRDEVIKQFEQKLAAVLTQTQLAAFSEIKPEAKLRFNFRFQRWADVLEWFAKQADLSLV